MTLLSLVLACAGDDGEDTPKDDTPETDTAETGETGDPDDTGDSTHTGETGDPCATPVATFTRDDGAVDDLTASFLSGEYVTLDSPGTLSVCPGTWFSRVLVRANVAVEGLGDTPEVTVLSGGESGTILDVLGADVTLTVSNVTLDRGAGLAVEHNSGGGAIYCQGDEDVGHAAVAVSDVVFSNNTANDGAGLYGVDCDIAVADSTFVDNVSEDDGGAFTLWFSTATVDDTTFADNVGLDGGAIAMFYSTATFTGGAITGNRAGNFAGGVWVYDSALTMTGTTISGNDNATGEQAGGLLVDGTATLDGVTFADNVASKGGGLFVYWEATVEGIACDFSGNTPDDLFVADYSEAGGVSYAGGNGYSFSCAANACTGG